MTVYINGVLDRIDETGLEWTLNKLLKGAGAGANPTKIDGLADLAEKAHASLTGITATQHHSNANDHAQAHTHVSHSGIGASDHHVKTTSVADLTNLFDATNPSTQAHGDSPAVGAASTASRRDHKHGMPAAGGASSSGTYAGNNAVNRAIPHGLGVTPRFIFIVHSNFGPIFFEMIGRAAIHYENGAAANNLAVTAPDATNFYVGNATDTGQSANDSATTYYWVAIG